MYLFEVRPNLLKFEYRIIFVVLKCMYIYNGNISSSLYEAQHYIYYRKLLLIFSKSITSMQLSI